MNNLLTWLVVVLTGFMVVVGRKRYGGQDGVELTRVAQDDQR